MNQTSDSSPGSVPTLRPQAVTLRRIVFLYGNLAGAAFVDRCRDAQIHVSVMRLHDAKLNKRTGRNFTADTTMQWSLLGTEEGLQTILRFVQHHNAQALVTSDEFALLWLARNRHRFAPDCILLAPDEEVIAALAAKDHQCEVARRAGFEVLPTWALHSAGVAAIPGSAFPVCVRPGTFSSVTPSFKAETFADSASLSSFLANHRWTTPPVAQPFVSGPNIVVHGVRSAPGMEPAPEWLALRAYRAPVKTEGFAVVLEPIPLPRLLENACKQFSELSGAHGSFHFDLLQDDATGSLYFLEINLRLGGSTAKVMTLGLDEPMEMLRAFGFSLPHQPKPLPRYRAAGSTRLLLSHLRNVLLRRATLISYPRARTWQNVATILRYACVMRDPSLH